MAGQDEGEITLLILPGPRLEVRRRKHILFFLDFPALYNRKYQGKGGRKLARENGLWWDKLLTHVQEKMEWRKQPKSFNWVPTTG
jgi:hypothetical protein